jgi:Tol biopolymer transport system component
VMLMSALGGQEKELFRGKNHMGAFRSDQLPVHPFLSWSADSTYLFIVGPNRTNPDGFAIFRLAESGDQKQVTFPSPGHGADGGAAVSADGRRLAFVRTTNHATLDLYTVMLGKDSLPAGQPRRILSDVWIEGLAWTADSREIVFAGSVHGKESFWRIGVDGERTAQSIAGLGLNAARSKLKSGDEDRGTDLAISPQGQYLVYGQMNTDMNIWRVGLRGREKGRPTPLIHSTRDESVQAYSSDGQKIAFESDRSGTEEIWVANADGSNATQLTTFNSGWSGSPNFSPDGQSIAFDRQEVLSWAIYVMSAQGGNPVRVAAGAADNFRPSWSSDGRWIFFTSDRTGRDEIWKVRRGRDRALQVTKTGGTFQREAPDGKAIYYMKEADSVRSLWKCAEDGTQNHKVLDSVLYFALGKSGIYFLPGKWSPTLPLRFFDFHTKQTTTLLFLDGTRIDLRMSVSPDERWLLFGQQDGTLGDLMLVKNFR